MHISLLNSDGIRADFSEVGTRAPLAGQLRGGRRWPPVALLCVGLLVTYLMASSQARAAGREQELIFDNHAQEAVVALQRAADFRTSEFLSSVNFIYATHPSPVSEFEAFFGKESEYAPTGIDPGVFFVEPVQGEDLEALVARERALGNADFDVTSFGRPPDRPHLIITRTGRDVAVGGFNVRGMDISTMLAALVPQDLPDDGLLLSAQRSETMLGFFFAPEQADEIQSELSEVIIAITGAVADPAGGDAPAGWAIRFFSADILFGAIEEHASDDLSVRLSADGIGELTTLRGNNIAAEPQDAALSERYSIDTEGLRWSIDVWAEDDFRVATGVLDQTATWILGSILSVLLALFSVWRSGHRYQLEATEFELEHARTLASTDVLTGLLNRQGLMLAVDRSSQVEPATVFFVDLDGFKGINDTLGHAEGDAVLKSVAETLRSTFRSRDIIGRYGGDEFLVYAVGVSTQHVVAETSERLVAAIDALDGDFTSSVGVATRATGDSIDNDALIREADRAMYRAKHTGGGRFELAVSG